MSNPTAGRGRPVGSAEACTTPRPPAPLVCPLNALRAACRSSCGPWAPTLTTKRAAGTIGRAAAPLVPAWASRVVGRKASGSSRAAVHLQGAGGGGGELTHAQLGSTCSGRAAGGV